MIMLMQLLNMLEMMNNTSKKNTQDYKFSNLYNHNLELKLVQKKSTSYICMNFCEII